MYTNMSTSDRAVRIALSLGFIVSLLATNGPLGALVVLPFISIYLGVTAFIGWDPVIALIGKMPKRAQAKHPHGHHGELTAH